ncbi:MAG TPA: hydratase [Microvirga sp.]|jgi:2-oxo-3-hexenedioate decarboxylase|nr:hydratase [Microvirga sp.]
MTTRIETEPTGSRPGRIAGEILAAHAERRQIAPLTLRPEGLTMPEAYRVAEAVRALREARGERAVGRKIGFTNRTIWDEYDVHAPIWGTVYDSTLYALSEIAGAFDPAGLVEPRIEPEIVFGLGAAPDPGMDARDLLGCVAWVAHGFEVVQSLYPGWRFKAPDTVAAFGLHGALLLGPRHELRAGARDRWAEDLARLEITLRCDGAAADHGRASHVLGGGPLAALHHLVEVLAADPDSPPLSPGEIVTTGTLTKALPVARGQTWSTTLQGTSMAGIAVRFGGS